MPLTVEKSGRNYQEVIPFVGRNEGIQSLVKSGEKMLIKAKQVAYLRKREKTTHMNQLLYKIFP